MIVSSNAVFVPCKYVGLTIFAAEFPAHEKHIISIDARLPFGNGKCST